MYTTYIKVTAEADLELNFGREGQNRIRYD